MNSQSLFRMVWNGSTNKWLGRKPDWEKDRKRIDERETVRGEEREWEGEKACERVRTCLREKGKKEGERGRLGQPCLVKDPYYDKSSFPFSQLSTSPSLPSSSATSSSSSSSSSSSLSSSRWRQTTNGNWHSKDQWKLLRKKLTRFYWLYVDSILTASTIICCPPCLLILKLGNLGGSKSLVFGRF